jgi:hypothetical protein
VVVTTLTPLLRTRTTVVWLGLTLATLLSWSLGGHHTLGLSGSHGLAGISILLIAFVKVRFVGLYFMDLRGAPVVLRSMFEAYCAAVCAVLAAMFLLA